MNSKARYVKLMIFDVDGVFTDGSLHYGEHGEILKTFHALDGHGIKLLKQAGILVAIISARQSPMLNQRIKDLGIDYAMTGISDKQSAFKALLQKTSLQEKDCGYMGDDIIDLPILMRVSFSVSVPNGHPDVKSRVVYITQAMGGRGAIREVCDLILKAQHKYQTILESYLK